MKVIYPRGARLYFAPFKKSVEETNQKAFQSLLKEIFWESVTMVRDGEYFANALVRDDEGNLFWANKKYLRYEH